MIYVVSGTPRSFTSCMMKALHVGGLPAVKSYERDRVGKKLCRTNYEPNPGGELWEPSIEEVTTLGFPRQYDGCVIKVLASWLPCMAVHDYRVVFMLRNPLEVYESFATMLNNTEFTPDFIRREQEEAQLWLRNRRDVHCTSVFDTDQLMRDPLWVFETLVQDGWPIDPVKAAAIVEPRRQRVAV